jgi:hypothetical protein
METGERYGRLVLALSRNAVVTVLRIARRPHDDPAHVPIRRWIAPDSRVGHSAGLIDLYAFKILARWRNFAFLLPVDSFFTLSRHSMRRQPPAYACYRHRRSIVFRGFAPTSPPASPMKPRLTLSTTATAQALPAAPESLTRSEDDG